MAAPAAQSFEASPIPSAELVSREHIRFLHPGYSAPANTLFTLPRVDCVASDTSQIFGVHHRTALLACQIIANNAFTNSRLTLDQSGQQQVNIDLDDILTESNYYLIVGNGPGPYPVVPSFKDWEFPHGRIPDSWPALSSPIPSPRCGITNFPGPLEEAHLVPQNETDWFAKNDMGMYGPVMQTTIHNPANIIFLRDDIHTCFNRRLFVILPKAFTSTPESSKYVVHILSDSPVAAAYWATHHHTLVQHLHLKSRPYLLARFAWAILFHVKHFVTQGFSRRVVVRVDNKDTPSKYEEQTLDGAQLMDSYGGGGSLAATPLKRKRKADVMDEDGNFADSPSDEEWDEGDVWDYEGVKRRKQDSSEKTAPDIKPQLPADVEGELRDALVKAILTTSQEDPREVEMALRLK